MIIVTTGSRTWTNESLIKAKMQEFQKEFGSELTIVVGYDKFKKKPIGADKIVYKWCDALGIHVICEPADWENGRVIKLPNGRVIPMAGMDRNELMLDKYQPNLVVAFRAEGKSNGTDHCVKEARRRHIPVQLNHEQP